MHYFWLDFRFVIAQIIKMHNKFQVSIAIQIRNHFLCSKSENLENIFHFLRDVHSKIIILPFSITIAEEFYFGFKLFLEISY